MVCVSCYCHFSVSPPASSSCLLQFQAKWKTISKDWCVSELCVQMKFSLVASRGHTVNCLTTLFNVASWKHTTPPTLLQHVCPPSLSPHPSSTHHMYSSCPLRLLCSRSSFLYMLLILRWRCSHFFCLILHCVSVSGVTSVVLPYGRWHHAVLPQGRTTDGMLGGVCVRSSVRQSIPSHKPQAERQGPWERLVLVLQLVVVLLVALILSNTHPYTICCVFLFCPLYLSFTLYVCLHIIFMCQVWL